jgi:hypothetical protein
MNVLEVRVDDRRPYDVLSQLLAQADSYTFAFAPLCVARDVETVARQERLYICSGGV